MLINRTVVPKTCKEKEVSKYAPTIGRSPAVDQHCPNDKLKMLETPFLPGEWIIVADVYMACIIDQIGKAVTISDSSDHHQRPQ